MWLNLFKRTDKFVALRKELNRWDAAGRTCQLWLRDDDLAAITPQFNRLRALVEKHDVPALLAVIPGQAAPTLGKDTMAVHHFQFAQHGWRHQNHEQPENRKSEFGPARSSAAIRHDMLKGARRMGELFGERYINVFVPPWNNLAPDSMAATSYAGMSRHVSMGKIKLPAGMVETNTHVDLMRWTATPSLQAPDWIAAQLSHYLGRQRKGKDTLPAVGLLSHHLVMDGDGWQFLDELLALTSSYPCVRWAKPSELFHLPVHESGPLRAPLVPAAQALGFT
ncbi:hypothetical protein [Pseudoduganella rhizocola]|uniref:hypothetical protein n=1 Tax=Pseudoduganella rhizocola TaxID=3382643 RepID=UPI0038B51042